MTVQKIARVCDLAESYNQNLNWEKIKFAAKLFFSCKSFSTGKKNYLFYLFREQGADLSQEKPFAYFLALESA